MQPRSANCRSRRPLLPCTSNSLSDFARFVDCGNEIILATCGSISSSGPESEFLHEKIKTYAKRYPKQGFAAGALDFSQIKGPVKFFKEVHNSLKHTSNCLRAVTVLVQSRWCYGYFVESSDPNGTLGPSIVFHSRPGDQRSANSFNRDLSLLYYAIYLTADALRGAVLFALQDRGIPLPTAVGTVRQNACEQLFSLVRGLPTLYFSSEREKRFKFLPSMLVRILNICVLHRRRSSAHKELSKSQPRRLYRWIEAIASRFPDRC